MLPPVDADVLDNNPDFANLYKSLTSNALNADGSSRNDAGAEKRRVVRHELKTRRLTATGQHLLVHAISTTGGAPTPQPAKQHGRTKPASATSAKSADATQLPPEVLELLLLLPPFLEQAQTYPPSSLDLLLSNPPFSSLPHLLPQLTSLVASRLTAQASALARVLHPATNPSFLHRAIPQILPTTRALLVELATKRAELTRARLASTATLVAYLNRHTDALVLLLRILEVKHVPAAHSSELRATASSLEAQVWATSLQLLAVSMRGFVYPPAARGALDNYRRHLGAAKMRVADSIRTRVAELGDYGVFVQSDHSPGGTGLGIGKGDPAKERMMREMARVWRDMEGRMKEIQKDLERLHGS